MATPTTAKPTAPARPVTSVTPRDGRRGDARTRHSGGTPAQRGGANVPTYQRQAKGRGFCYRDAEGSLVCEPETLTQLRSLAVPPAWTEVEINLDPAATIVATGRDGAGRKQYIYSQSYRLEQEKQKYDKLLAFGEALPTAREAYEAHLRHRTYDRAKVLATVLKLIDLAHFRVGNDQYVKAGSSYGITTLRSRHVEVEGNTLIFDFTGKSGQWQHREIVDRRLATIVSELDSLPGYEVFKYFEDGARVDVKSDDVNAYIRELMGDQFSAKDFRTWGGTTVFAMALDDARDQSPKRPVKRYVTDAVKATAASLGNTPAVARQSYIDPRVPAAYLEQFKTVRDFTADTARQTLDDRYIAAHEHAVLALLKATPYPDQPFNRPASKRPAAKRKGAV